MGMSEKELAEKHAEQNKSAIHVPERKMGQGLCLTPPKTQNIGSSSEVRIVDPTTGGEKGSKLERYDLIPPEALQELARHYGRGARKYDDNNWRRGYKWGLSYAALMRHLEAWRQGERIDPETGSHHLIAVAWHAFALFTFDTMGLGTNDLTLKPDQIVI